MTQIRQGHVEDALNALLSISKRPFPVAARIKIVALKKCLADQLSTFVEVKNAIILQHGKDGMVNPTMESWPAAVKEFEELANTMVEITPLPLELFDGDFGEDFDILASLGAINITGGGSIAPLGSGINPRR